MLSGIGGLILGIFAYSAGSVKIVEEREYAVGIYGLLLGAVFISTSMIKIITG